ncbi:MAG: NUDIX domain-containing protein [Calothrix sp. SM1_5_4]|nr:NUDIX domain-containing protein [Calothrix sp. SM1_5_4]
MREFGEIFPGIHYTERPGAYGLLCEDGGRLAVIETSFGRFLPGGGLDPGEDALTGLAREIMEEIGYLLLSAELAGQAAQYHWSEFYQMHFKKIGSFYRITATTAPAPTLQEDHSLIWLKPDEATKSLSQEFQRYAVGAFL